MSAGAGLVCSVGHYCCWTIFSGSLSRVTLINAECEHSKFLVYPGLLTILFKKYWQCLYQYTLQNVLPIPVPIQFQRRIAIPIPILVWYCWANTILARSVFNINHTSYDVASSLSTKTYTLSLKLMTCINIRHQKSLNPEILLDWLREVCNSYKTEILWILPFCSIKVLTIGISRNQLPILKNGCQYQYQ